jgi:2-polyprenyl-6-methoxyphenol hydroxylase-like FAD-dependent oxidoreductase
MSGQPPKQIVIVGGSLGGLFTGIVFSRLGYDVTILERTPSEILKDQGAGLSVSPCLPPILASMKKLVPSGSPVTEFFTEYNRLETPYCDESSAAGCFRFLRKDGNVKQDVNLPIIGTCSWDLLYNVLRANFDGGYEKGYVAAARKVEGDGKARYLSGVRFVGVQDLGEDLVKVEYEDQNGKLKTLDANILIGADGPSSTVRKLMQPETERSYAGYVAWRGNVIESEVSQETLDVIGENVTFFYYKGGHILQ